MKLTAIPREQELQVEQWHHSLSAPEGAGIATCASRIHYENFTLWHLEDRARDRQVSDSEIAQIKREIDKNNQRRNDCIEKLDEAVLAEVAAKAPPPKQDSRLHSETAGSLVDRLSINALKIFHMREQAERPDASAEHRRGCQGKLELLQVQRGDLHHCLTALESGLMDGTLFYKIYRQLKMYNDPNLNPFLYGKRPG